MSCYKLFRVGSFVLEVGSWTSNEVTVNLYQMLLSVLTRKGKVPRHNFPL